MRKSARICGLPEGGYHVVLANPPFAGKVDNDRVVDDVKVGNSKATEVLFLKYMMESLKAWRAVRCDRAGRACCLVPQARTKKSDGSSLRTTGSRLSCRLPGGVFQPYSGVKTSVLLFKKGGKTDRVMFLHVDQ